MIHIFHIFFNNSNNNHNNLVPGTTSIFFPSLSRYVVTCFLPYFYHLLHNNLVPGMKIGIFVLFFNILSTTTGT